MKKSSTVIPGRTEGTHPESSHTDFLRIFWIPDRRLRGARNDDGDFSTAC
jgi:hypothetical protein